MLFRSGERVQVVDNTNGARLETYVIPGKRGSGCICINGAAAHLVKVGDTVIIMAYALMEPEEGKAFKPSVVFPTNDRLTLSRNNVITSLRYYEKLYGIL